MACTGELSNTKKTQLGLLLDQQLPDWERLAQLSNHHRLSPFLYRALREIPDIPDAILSSLHQECQAIATDNLLKLHEYKQVATLLAEHKIDQISFKGIYLAQHSYPQSSLRSIGDFDILVGQTDLYKTVGILATAGYQVGERYSPYLRYDKSVMLNELNEISLFKPFYGSGRFDIDLHWKVDCLLKEIGSLQLHDVLSSTHPVESQVLLLTLHHGLTNSWERIGYINDLYFLLSSTDIDWSWLLVKLKTYKVEFVFFIGLQWCEELWSFPVPAMIQKLISKNQLSLLAKGYEIKWERNSLNLLGPKISFFVKTQTLFIDKLTIYIAYIRSFISRSSLIKIKNYQFFIRKKWGFTTIPVRVLLTLIRIGKSFFIR